MEIIIIIALLGLALWWFFMRGSSASVSKVETTSKVETPSPALDIPSVDAVAMGVVQVAAAVPEAPAAPAKKARKPRAPKVEKAVAAKAPAKKTAAKKTTRSKKA